VTYVSTANRRIPTPDRDVLAGRFVRTDRGGLERCEFNVSLIGLYRLARALDIGPAHLVDD
jgi:hypothetical protein